MWVYFPDTLDKPLEEIVALFGNQDEVAAYMPDITIDDDFDGRRSDKAKG